MGDLFDYILGTSAAIIIMSLAIAVLAGTVTFVGALL